VEEEKVVAAIMFGLLSAITYGAADFTGGITSRRANSYAVVIWADILAMPIIATAAWLVGDSFPSMRGVWFSLACGLFGGVGILLLYRSFAEGKMSIAAPVSALMAGILPVLVGAFTQGLPSMLVITGMAVALAAIWLVAREEGSALQFNWENVRLPLIAGVLFGMFFVLMHEVSSESILWPIFLLRLSAVAILVLIASTIRQPMNPPFRQWYFLLMISVFDVAGNMFFILANRVGRLDVAAVLASLYPGATVLLAWVFLKEHISRSQWTGVLLAMVAIALIAL
jgi:uncharacterized membrane protein